MHSVGVVSSCCLVYSASLAKPVSNVFPTLINGSKAFPTYCTGASGLEDGALSGVPGSVDLDRERELQPKSSVPQVKLRFWVATNIIEISWTQKRHIHLGGARQYWVQGPSDVHLHKRNNRPPQGSRHKTCSLHPGKVVKPIIKGKLPYMIITFSVED